MRKTQILYKQLAIQQLRARKFVPPMSFYTFITLIDCLTNIFKTCKTP